MTDRRTDELAGALRAVRDRIATACADADRDPGEVRLLAVTKTFPADDVARLVDLGLTDFAENRDQEASGKVVELARRRAHARLRWHMVGRLQRNKARSVARWADEVQSVDSARLIAALASAARGAIDDGSRTAPLDVLLQASLDDDPSRGGCAPSEVVELADLVTRSGDLRLRGLMAVAPLGAPQEPAFERLAELADAVRAAHPGAVELSAGMSGDLEAAIKYGSTCVRVGTALLGGRRLASP